MRRISRLFAIVATEVTVGQFREFLQDTDESTSQPQDSDVLGSMPAQSVSWFRAAEYCNWLSRVEGIPEDQWVYAPNSAGEYAGGMRIKESHLELSGYRLPTEAEWEFACRAGSLTRRYYGDTDTLLDRYAWYADNSQRRTMPVGSLIPNRFGLFDMHGNVREWCGNRYLPYPADSTNTPVDDIVAGQIVLDNEPRPLRSYSYIINDINVRSANRLGYLPSNESHYIGFRPARTIIAANAGAESTSSESLSK